MESRLRRERQPGKRKAFSLRLCCQVLCIATLPMLVLGFGFAPISGPVEAHGGGLDGDGGHNCYVGACAGSYHCHQSRGPRCGGGWSQGSSAPSWSVASCVLTSGGSFTRGEVGKIQANLKFWGFNPGPIDGKYGPKTRAALNRFEDRAGIPRSTGQFINVLSVRHLWAAC